MPDVNQGNPLVATYLIQNFLWWVEYDGPRWLPHRYLPLLRPAVSDAVGQGHSATNTPGWRMFGEAWEGTEAEQAFFAQNILPPVNGFKSNLPGVLDFQICFAISRCPENAKTAT